VRQKKRWNCPIPLDFENTLESTEHFSKNGVKKTLEFVFLGFCSICFLWNSGFTFFLRDPYRHVTKYVTSV
jgi:hypothetical protein